MTGHELRAAIVAAEDAESGSIAVDVDREDGTDLESIGCGRNEGRSVVEVSFARGNAYTGVASYGRTEYSAW